MATFRKVAKARQKNHLERSQPEAREHLGLLEKKKDYILRANEHHRKQNTIKALKRKALDRNPDEFYFNMVRSRVEDGVHHEDEEAPEYTEEQLKLIQTQDIRYVTFKRSLELKKIEKLKGNLHLLDAVKPKNSHIIFVDNKREVEEFDAARHLQTDPALLDRTYNRPRLDTLSEYKGKRLGDSTMAEMAAERSKLYAVLHRRIEREKKLRIIAEKMEVKRQLLDKSTSKKKVSKETVNSAAVYQWVAKRKR